MKFLCIFSFLFFFICKLTIGMNIDKLNIIAGSAKITGRIIIPDGISKDSIFVIITVPHPISGEHARYEAAVDQSGNFS